MELRHLRYFVAVAEELNFRRAAERLRVAQPALSSQIKDLEFDVGARLLDRDTRGVRLTDAGVIFLEEARLIVTHAERAAGLAREAAKGRRGRLTVGYFAPIFMGLMPDSLKQYREKYPEVDVAVVDMGTLDQLAALESGAIQIAFMVGGTARLPPHMRSVLLARSPLCVVMHRTHRLARARRINLSELQEEQLLCFSARKGVASVQGDIIRRIFSSRGLQVKSLRQIEGVEAFRATLDSGLGLSLISESISLSENKHVVVRPLKETGSDLYVELHAVWRSNQESQLVANFVAVMKEIAPAREVHRLKRPISTP